MMESGLSWLVVVLGLVLATVALVALVLAVLVLLMARSDLKIRRDR